MNTIMMEIPAQKTIYCPISIASDLLAHPERWLPNQCLDNKLVVITDDNVKQYYGDSLLNKLNKHDTLLLSISPGEKSKNSQTKQYLEDQMLNYRCGRDTTILALGGGVVGDIAGFTAATYMRGISYIQLPTTLLAMVDSSVGGKTGIDTIQGKNLIGAFWQPTSIIVDMNCLTTLSRTHLVNGLIEALKMFMTSDIDSFNFSMSHIEDVLAVNLAILQKIVEKAISIKINVVNKDEKEHSLRSILNFGHTIGHALEKVSNYTILHGYAVALGILVEAKISQLSGVLSHDDYQVIKSLFLTLNISGCQLQNLDIEKIIHATKSDKKVKSDSVRYVLLKKIGQVCHDDVNFVYPVQDEIVRRALLSVNEV